MNEQTVKIRQLKYQNQKALTEINNKRSSKSSSLGRNPIKIVVDMIGEDGVVHQKIINQQREDLNSRLKSNSFGMVKSPQRQNKTQYLLINEHKKLQQRPIITRSLVFNRFNYDNYQQIPIPKTINSKYNINRGLKPGHKNIEIVFCQSKYPEFIQKTNVKIEELYKQEQLRDQIYHKSALQSSINLTKTFEKANQPKRSLKTNLANCLKEYATLQKLSLFMQNDQRRRQQCLCYSVEKDPSRTLLLDIITHRFNFLKKMSRGCRQNVYRCLLGREINSLTKINIQEYMKISQMFVGRDASNTQVATFMYLFLFGERVPTIELAQHKLENLNGQIHRMRAILEELYEVINKQDTTYLVDELSKRERLLRLFIDYIIERG